MFLHNSGNVGIGSVNALDKLHVYEEVNSAIATQLLLQNQGAGNHAAGIAFQVTSSAEAALTVYAPKAAIIQERTASYGRGPLKFIQDNAADANPFGAGDEVMRITNEGRVGIGTTAPSMKLHVLDGTSSLRFRQNGTVSEILLNGPSGGDAALYFGDVADGVRGGLYYDTSENAFQIRGYNNNTRMTIDSAGNVGINTTSPVKKLHVNGPALATIGTLTDGATITPDFDANQNFSVTLGGNRTLANPTNIDAGQTGSIFVVQDGTGSRTLSFGTYWKFAGGTAPTLSTAAGSVDRIDYIVYTTTAIHAVATLNVS